MLAKNTCFLALGLISGCLFMYNAAASQSGDNHMTMQTIVAQQRQKLVRSADSTLGDARSAMLQARHVLMEDKPAAHASDPDYLRLQHIVAREISGIKRAKNIVNQDEKINPDFKIKSMWLNYKLVS